MRYRILFPFGSAFLLTSFHLRAGGFGGGAEQRGAFSLPNPGTPARSAVLNGGMGAASWTLQEKTRVFAFPVIGKGRKVQSR